MKSLLSLIIITIISTTCFSQYVETLIIHPELRDGIHVDFEGNIYTTSGGFAGFEVGKYDTQLDVFDPNYITNMPGPVDVDAINDSMLVITNYDSNTVSSYNRNTGASEIIATGLDGPSGIVKDALGNIYVANWGNAPAYNGHQIHKISTTGQVSVYIDSPLLYRPQAMTINADGALVIQSNDMLYTVNPSDSTLQFWVDLGQGVAHMKYRELDSCIYASANDQILKIEPSGAINVFGGSTPGYVDGPIETAKFLTLFGIDFSPNEDTLYVLESAYIETTGKLRRIVMDEVLGIEDQSQIEFRLYPNPSDAFLNIESKQAFDHVEIFDILGNSVLMKSWDYAIAKRKLDVVNLNRGMYIIRVRNGDNIVTSQKIFKN